MIDLPYKSLLAIFGLWFFLAFSGVVLYLDNKANTKHTNDTDSDRIDTHLTIETVNYRKVAKDKLNKGCNICGITDDYLLAVHHRDHDRSNNTVSNFEVLCFNHHVLRHLTNRNERIIYSPRGLTPEDIRIKVGMPSR